MCSVRRLALTMSYKEENVTGYIRKHTGLSHAYASNTVNSVWDGGNLHCLYDIQIFSYAVVHWHVVQATKITQSNAMYRNPSRNANQ